MPDAIEPLTRASLLIAVKEGDAKAWTAFAERYAALIRARCQCWRLQPANVEDLTQDVMTKLVVAMPKYVHDPDQGFRPWLKLVIRNTVIDGIRKARRRPGDQGHGGDLSDALGGVPDPASAGADEIVMALEELWERDRRFRDACRRVEKKAGPQVWRAFWLMEVEGLTGREVAEALGVPIARTYRHQKRALKMLREEAESPEPLGAQR